MDNLRWPRTGASNDLRRLHHSYVAAVNHAIGLDRDELVRELADAYLDEALHLLTDQAAGTRPT